MCSLSHRVYSCLDQRDLKETQFDTVVFSWFILWSSKDPAVMLWSGFNGLCPDLCVPYTLSIVVGVSLLVLTVHTCTVADFNKV